MPTTKEDIRGWLKSAMAAGATHVLVACDTFDHEDYPVSVLPGTNVTAEVERVGAQPMTRIMEVYALHLGIEAQLNELRAYHLEEACT